MAARPVGAAFAEGYRLALPSIPAALTQLLIKTSRL